MYIMYYIVPDIKIMYYHSRICQGGKQEFKEGGGGWGATGLS